MSDTTALNPDCRDGKHAACGGDAWDDVADLRVRCACSCHGMGAPSKPPRDEHDQPLPTHNEHPVVQELVLTDLQARLEVGIQRYGTGLQPHNGRDMLRDAYDEAMDLVVYLRGCLYERDGR